MQSNFTHIFTLTEIIFFYFKASIDLFSNQCARAPTPWIAVHALV